MEEDRFHQAVNEAISISNRLVKPEIADTLLKEEYEKLFMVLDRTEMKGTAVNAKLKQAWEWIELRVKLNLAELKKEYAYSQLPTNEENDNEDMDVKTVEEILKLCTVLHDSPDSGIEEASGIDLVRMQLEDILITLGEKRNDV